MPNFAQAYLPDGAQWFERGVGRGGGRPEKAPWETPPFEGNRPEGGRGRQASNFWREVLGGDFPAALQLMEEACEGWSVQTLYQHSEITGEPAVRKAWAVSLSAHQAAEVELRHLNGRHDDERHENRGELFSSPAGEREGEGYECVACSNCGAGWYEADACTEDAILGQPEEIQRMLGAAVSRDISSLARCALHAPVAAWPNRRRRLSRLARGAGPGRRLRRLPRARKHHQRHRRM